MSDDKDRFIFTRELTRLCGECERCENVRVKREIVKDIILLKQAIEILVAR